MEDTSRILAKGELRSNNTKKTRMNNNDLVIGTGEQRELDYYVIPNIMQGNESMIVTDSNGELQRQLTPLLEEKGYCIQCMNCMDFSQSNGYNPLDYIRHNQETNVYEIEDISLIAKVLMEKQYFTGRNASKVMDRNKNSDVDILRIYIMFAIAYVMERNIEIDRDIKNVIEFLDSGFLRLSEEKKNKAEKEKEILRKKNANSVALHLYSMIEEDINSMRFYNQLGRNLMVLSDGWSKLSSATHEMDSSRKPIYFESLSRRKTILFIRVSDTNRYMEPMVNLFYTQAIQSLCKQADENENGRLRIPVRIFINHIAMEIRIPDFDKIITTISSKEIHVSIVIEYIKQLYDFYGDKKGKRIMDYCATCLYLGTQDVTMAEYLAEEKGITAVDIMCKGVENAILFTAGEKSKLVTKYDITKHLDYKKLVQRQSELKEIESELDSYKRAAEQGDVDAQCSLATCYMNGDGVEKNIRNALMWYLEAAEQGSESAQSSLDEYYAKVCVSEVEKWYRNPENMESKKNSLMLYYSKVDIEEALEGIKWYIEIANQGDIRAMNELAELGAIINSKFMVSFIVKRCCSQDDFDKFEVRDLCSVKNEDLEYIETLIGHEDVMRWNQMAIENGNLGAYYHMGCFYMEGIVVEQSYKEAIKWFERALENGIKVGWEMLGDCCEQEGSKESYEKAIYYWNKIGADEEDVDGQKSAIVKIAKCYAKGKGVEQDEELAKEMWSELIKVGEELYMPALEALGEYYGEKEGEEREHQILINYCTEFVLGSCDENEDVSYEEDVDDYEENDYEENDYEENDYEEDDYEEDEEFVGDPSIALEYGEACREALKKLEELAEIGIIEAQVALANCHKRNFKILVDIQTKYGYDDGYSDEFLTGSREIAQYLRGDIAIAIKWYLKLAEQGNVTAQFELADCWCRGLGVEREMELAVDWYEKAAAQGDERAKDWLKKYWEQHKEEKEEMEIPISSKASNHTRSGYDGLLNNMFRDLRK